jgi:hypothetical protein
MPQGLYDADALHFLAERGIDVAPNHRGELSIPVADAQYLWDDAAKRATDEVAARAKAATAERERLEKLAAQRQETYETELYAAAARGIGSAKAMQAARSAVDRVEANLDATTRSQLGRVWSDDGKLGSALLAGLQRSQDEANEREAAHAREVSVP